ncbi:MAG TPA: ROK family protein [Candidatus Stercorousia faecigallinarum]|nr:ROK family protein [Candidatus Stercorousia faecigallinarum]
MLKKALAIDVGGTKIYNAIVNEKGEIISEIEKRPTPKTFAEIKAVFEEIISKYERQVDVIAFSTCGAVNNQNSGILGSTGNIAREYPSMDFKSLSKKPVFVENDANAAAWAEHIIGASKGMPYSVMLTLGTGVGGGIILDNKLYKGKNGAAGEMHFKMRTDKHRKCTCGSYDCFEAYASGTGLKRTAEEISGDDEITTYDVIENRDRPLMKKILDKWQNDILEGIIGLANIFDPDVIVLSGSMAEFVNIDYIEAEANKQIVTTPFKVVKASAGNYSGMIGAALLALGVK